MEKEFPHNGKCYLHLPLIYLFLFQLYLMLVELVVFANKDQSTFFSYVKKFL